MNRLKIYFFDFVLPDIIRQNIISNRQELSTIKNISLHLNLKRSGIRRENFLDGSLALYLISGGRSIPNIAKRGNLNLNIQKNDITGVSLILSGEESWMFLDRLINIALPRLKDFRGINSSSWDTNRDLTFNIADLIAFPELESNYDSFSHFKDMNITISMTSQNKALNLHTLQSMRLPFVNKIV